MRRNWDSYHNLATYYSILQILTKLEILAIANYEFFSSMLKGFQVFGTNRYPAQQWTPLGNFSAQNVRRLQYQILSYLIVKLI
jgi:hypothetical protein